MNTSCKSRINGELASRIEDLRQLWTAYQNGEEDIKDLGNIFEYGLCFDYVAPHTFKNQARGYFRYQLSYGGPSDEFRFYAEGESYKWNVDRVEYVFLDWFDGSKRVLSGNNRNLLEEIFQSLFVERGSADAEFTKAIDNM